MSLLLLNNKLTAADIGDEVKMDEAVIAQQLLLLCRQDLVDIDQNTAPVLYSINETHLVEVIEIVRQFGTDTNA